jgi:hypothetical protein
VGDWFLRVIPVLDEDFSFTIRAALATNGVLVSGSPIEFTVGPAPPPATGFELTWNTIPGERYLISRSVDLLTWVPLGTITVASATGVFQDPAPPPAAMLFYRVEPVP